MLVVNWECEVGARETVLFTGFCTVLFWVCRVASVGGCLDFISSEATDTTFSVATCSREMLDCERGT